MIIVSVAPKSGADDSVIVGRSVVATEFGIVAASQPLAARAGVSF